MLGEEVAKVAALEYKGEDRLSNEDTLYKQALGDDWAALDPENRYFRVVIKFDVAETLREGVAAIALLSRSGLLFTRRLTYTRAPPARIVHKKSEGGLLCC